MKIYWQSKFYRDHIHINCKYSCIFSGSIEPGVSGGQHAIWVYNFSIFRYFEKLNKAFI